jgi:hypothetical protein
VCRVVRPAEFRETMMRGLKSTVLLRFVLRVMPAQDVARMQVAVCGTAPFFQHMPPAGADSAIVRQLILRAEKQLCGLIVVCQAKTRVCKNLFKNRAAPGRAAAIKEPDAAKGRLCSAAAAMARHSTMAVSLGYTAVCLTYHSRHGNFCSRACLDICHFQSYKYPIRTGPGSADIFCLQRLKSRAQNYGT